MSDALATLRAIDAISMTLAERMALILRDVPDMERKGVRYLAYSRSGLNIHDFPSEEVTEADFAAVSAEISRRLTQ